MPFIVGTAYHFGLGFPAERVPAGWTLIESKTEFTRLRAPEGQEYLVCGDEAHPTKLTHGIRSVDKTAPVQLPTT